ncbi:MAG: DUF3054 domain-containing protein [Halodesulfurarchaeum sp.]
MAWLRVSRDTVRRLFPGDVFAILFFVVLGEFSHGISPWVYPLRVGETALTFLTAWVLVAPVLRAYSTDVRSRPMLAGATGFLAWVGADLLAQLLRSTTWVHGNAAFSFFLVAAGVGGLLIVGTRFIVVSWWPG